MNLTRVVTLGAAAALLAPAAAHAATLQTDLPCYIEGVQMGVAGSGWAPGSTWSVRADSIFAQGTADAAGNFQDITQIQAPKVRGKTTKPTTITLTGQQDGADVASTTFQVVDLFVHPKKIDGTPTKKTLWRFSGFDPGQPVYVHVSRKGKTYTQKVGTASKTCGTLSKRLHRLPAWPGPAKKIAFGNYKLAVDSRETLANPNGQYNQFRAVINIYRKAL